MKRVLGIIGGICIALLCWGGLQLHTYALSPEDEAWVEEARAALQQIVAEGDIMALVYLCEEYPVRSEAAADSEVLVRVPTGQTVFILDVQVDEDYQIWEKVSFFYGDGEYTGYIARENLAASDERFLEWEKQYSMNPAAGAATYAADGAATAASYADVESFPASYQPALRALKDQYPNWTFVKMNTGLDWNTVIANEIIGGKSLVPRSFAAYTKEGAYDNGSWYYASEDILKYYMDPRNGLQESGIFQFEQLTYNASYHTEAAVETFLASTFMSSAKNAPGMDITYAKIFWALGAHDTLKVSPFHLAARVLQEQGSKGDSPLISGTYPGYEGYYNYFNIGATGTTTTQVIVNGLAHAKKEVWNSPYTSIDGGARFISAHYIRRGQDTLYLQKYNVNTAAGNPIYTNQYMQNIAAPTSEAASIRNLYRGANSLNNTFVFKIPVYDNMPEAVCAMPTSSTNVVLQMPEGYTDPTIYLDGVAYTAAVRNGRYIVKAADANAKTAVAYRYNASGVVTGMYLWTLTYADGAYTATAQPELADLLTYHGFSIRITGNSGIRYKTGISTDVRARLTSGGINGYTLKEYGTLVMNNANRTAYPMIKGGEKVLSGMSYGINAGGGMSDVIYETVDGRHRFTSVLVGLPANQYKTEYAFRGYAILEKNGTQITVYGPIVARSIYSLAEQVLAIGSYPQGSEADTFLRQLIADGNQY